MQHSCIDFDPAGNDTKKASLAKLVTALNAPEKLFIFSAVIG